MNASLPRVHSTQLSHQIKPTYGAIKTPRSPGKETKFRGAGPPLPGVWFREDYKSLQASISFDY